MYKILIDDDREFIRTILTKVIRRKEYVVCESSCGNETIKKVGDICPDVVLLNSDMPNINRWNSMASNSFSGMLKGAVAILYSGSDRIREEFIVALLTGVWFLSKFYAFNKIWNPSEKLILKFLFS